jgi:hypothetical protein
MGNGNSSTSQIIPNDSLICMEEGRPNELIFTFYIVMHGASIETSLNESETKLFDNCRIFSKTGGNCISYASNSDLAQRNITIFKEHLQKDLIKTSYEIIDSCIQKNIKPDYIKSINSLSESELSPLVSLTDLKEDKDFIVSNCCKTLLSVKRDKKLSTENDNGLGIFLLSIHKKNQDGSLSYIPIKYSYVLNLIIISELQKFAEVFESTIPDLSRISNNYNIKKSFTLWSGIELSSDKTYIKTIRLSKFIEIINNILKNTGKKCNYNLIDDSCSKDVYNPYLKETFAGVDIKNMPNTGFFGGKKRKRKNTKIVKNNKNNKNNRTKRKK